MQHFTIFLKVELPESLDDYLNQGMSQSETSSTKIVLFTAVSLLNPGPEKKKIPLRY